MDVATLVRSIISSFEDACAVVKRIRDRKAGDHGESRDTTFVDELLESLELGPIVIRGYYASDAKRFGQPYVSGDGFAREQLKDVLIHLQMAVLTALRTVLVDNKNLDYAAIQSASDDCRVNAGVCLGQLSQRLSDPTRAFTQHATSFPFRMPTPPLHYSNSYSGKSSESPTTPTTPDMNGFELDYPGRLPGYNPHASSLRGKAHAVLQGPEIDAADSRRPSSSCLSADDHPVFSAVSPVSSTSHISPVSTRVMSQIGSIIGRTPSSSSVRDRFGPDDYSDTQNPRRFYSRSPRKQSSETASSRSSQYEIPRQVQVQRTPSPPPQFQTRRKKLPQDLRLFPTTYVAPMAASSSASVNAPIPVETEEIRPPVPPKSAARQTATALEPLTNNTRMISNDTSADLETSVGALNLPTEKNLLGFCKSAHRLQINSEKKAFGPANRPLGFSSMIPYWKCEKCFFEGPLSIITPPAGPNGKSGKAERVFDPAIREFEGIRFKWVFLAKCHVTLKSTPATSGQSRRIDGCSGSFGCIFCTAEGNTRGWFDAQSPNSHRGKNRTSTVGSISSTSTSSSATPIFGNAQSFMEHLQTHRRREFWPCGEMQKQMKCIVGRVAGIGEDFDINFMPADE